MYILVPSAYRVISSLYCWFLHIYYVVLWSTDQLLRSKHVNLSSRVESRQSVTALELEEGLG